MMIVETTWNFATARCWRHVVAALLMLPVCSAGAQDFDAVERRLGGAVEAGELTLDQARLMLEALKRSASHKRGHENEMEAKKRRYMAFAREIEEAVRAGKLSKEDAEKKLIAVRKEMFEEPRDKKASADRGSENEMEAKKRRYMAFAREIEEAVRAGKLSKEDAEKKLIAVRKEMFEEPRDKKASADRGSENEMEAKKRRYMAFAREIEAALKAGDISKEDAERKLNEVRKHMFRSHSHNKQEKKAATDRDSDRKKSEFMAIVRELKQAVDAGKLSPSEAEKKIIETRNKLFGKD